MEGMDPPASGSVKYIKGVAVRASFGILIVGTVQDRDTIGTTPYVRQPAFHAQLPAS